ncbi:MAG: 16S rRNA (cytidine(1402)-2'-O)-methyltransferase [Ruminococcaceae bacterium]|nr:16S rRNA (cytidine(1402)-2'-O)-methyltransferase [Oscillospiraceae bacterium]
MGKLYVVGTPIGNLGDFSPRAVKTLEECDFIAAEDTRVTLKLLNHFGIKKQMVSYFEHNRTEQGEKILARLLSGEVCALVTDAGMPAISDPGEDLVRLCHENGVAVESVPGPCAFSTALAISGMPSGRFTFEGFLSVTKNSRREHLESLKDEKRTMIFYEAPHKLGATLKDMYENFGERNIAIVREITKIHEEVIRTTFSEAVKNYGDGGLKGEIVLIIDGKKEEKKEISLEDAVEIALSKMKEGFSKNESAKFAAKQTGIKKGDIYAELTEVE